MDSRHIELMTALKMNSLRQVMYLSSGNKMLDSLSLNPQD